MKKTPPLQPQQLRVAFSESAVSAPGTRLGSDHGQSGQGECHGGLGKFIPQEMGFIRMFPKIVGEIPPNHPIKK